MPALEPRGGVVIKPYNGAGSRGVYLGFTNKFLCRIKTGEILHSWEEMKRSMADDLESGAVAGYRWIVEEMIHESQCLRTCARPEVFCFYGHSALALEIVRYPETCYCFWTRERVPIETGAYLDRTFSGNGFTEPMLEVTWEIILEIPSPFMRLHFHSTGAELVFCEITPHPGGAWLYSKSIDQMLGDAYLASGARLLNDFLAGKKFEAFRSLQRRFLQDAPPKIMCAEVVPEMSFIQRLVHQPSRVPLPCPFAFQ